MDSPFDRSTLMRRSPPNTPQQQTLQTPQESNQIDFELASTSEIQKWITNVDQTLNEICLITSEGKLNSEQKLRVANLCRKVGSASSQMAVLYQSLKQKAIQAHQTIKDLNNKCDLQECLTGIKTTIQETNANNSINQKVSFANMVKTGANNFIRPNSLNSVAIYPKDNKSSDETKSIVQKIIRPEEMKLQVRSLLRTKNGGVIISTENKEDLQKLKHSVQLNSSGLTLDESYKRRPRIIVLGVPTNMKESEVFTCIFEQNFAEKMTMDRDTFLHNIKLSHKSGKKDAQTCNYIIEVTAAIRKALITQSRVFINWTSCPVRDFTLVTRCYKCQQYGHAAKTCREPTPTCGHCAQGGHSMNECPNKAHTPKCATCTRFKKTNTHKTGDADCPAKKTAENRYINSIDYEGA